MFCFLSDSVRSLVGFTLDKWCMQKRAIANTERGLRGAVLWGYHSNVLWRHRAWPVAVLTTSVPTCCQYISYLYR